MADDSFVENLVVEFQERRERGEAISPADLCRGNQEMLAEVERRLRILKPLYEGLGSRNASATFIPPAIIQAKEHDQKPAIPGYEIAGVLGAGGMGVVYRARHLRLDRLVAIKMIRGGVCGADALARLRSETQSMAALQHPNIVQIFEVGEVAGQPYCVLELVAGGSLAERLRGEPQDPRKAAPLVETLARAMHEAHLRGIIHRDLKPGNVLLAADGQTPKITDFGLAKRLDLDSGQTQTGAVLGTPSYMAPEQAEGRLHDIGPGSDVYALGAILYEMLTGRPPFRAKTLTETLDQVRKLEPIAPRRLVPSTPRDLETICLKCLEKNPGRRYASGAELAEDLRRFAEHRPIQARPVSAFGRAARWCKRNKVVASLSTAMLATMILGTCVAWVLAVRANYHAGQAKVNENKAVEKAAAETRALKETEAERDKTKIQKERAEAALVEAELALYCNRIQMADVEWTAGNTQRVEELLDLCVPKEERPDFRSWEWHYFNRLCRHERFAGGQGAKVLDTFFNQEGRLQYVQADDKEIRIRDAVTGVVQVRLLPGGLPVLRAVVSANGMRLATFLAKSLKTTGTLQIWDLATSKKVWERDNLSSGILLDATGTIIFVPKELALWDVDANQIIFSPKGKSGAPTAFALSPSGQRLAIGGKSGQVDVWDVAQKTVACSFQLHTKAIHQLTFSHQEDWIASSDFDQKIWVWDAQTGAKATPLPVKQFGIPWTMAFSPSSSTLATGSEDGTLRLWEPAGGQLVMTIRGSRGTVRNVKFDPTGAKLVHWNQASYRLTDTGSPAEMRSVPVAGAHGISFMGNSHDLLMTLQAKKQSSLVRMSAAGDNLRTISIGSGETVVGFCPKEQKAFALNANEFMVFDDNLQRLPGKGPSLADTILAVSPLGGKLVVVRPDGRLRVLEKSLGHVHTDLEHPPGQELLTVAQPA